MPRMRRHLIPILLVAAGLPLAAFDLAAAAGRYAIDATASVSVWPAGLRAGPREAIDRQRAALDSGYGDVELRADRFAFGRSPRQEWRVVGTRTEGTRLLLDVVPARGGAAAERARLTYSIRPAGAVVILALHAGPGPGIDLLAMRRVADAAASPASGSEADGGSAWRWVWVGALIPLAIAVGVLAGRRRRRSP